MIDLNKKLEKIEKNCLEVARKEEKELKEENIEVCENEVNEKIENYKEFLANKYSNEIKRIERNYNKDMFNYGIEAKHKVAEFKDSLIENIKNKVISSMKDFSYRNEYKDFLYSSIRKILSKLPNNNNDTIIYISNEDYNKYSYEISTVFGKEVEIISKDIIGGALIVDNKDKISIDDTIDNNIDEIINKISL